MLVSNLISNFEVAHRVVFITLFLFCYNFYSVSTAEKAIDQQNEADKKKKFNIFPSTKQTNSNNSVQNNHEHDSPIENSPINEQEEKEEQTPTPKKGEKQKTNVLEPEVTKRNQKQR